MPVETADRLAEQGQALADGNRLILLKLIQDATVICVGDLALLSKMEQGKTSRNLRILWRAGLLNRWISHGLAKYELTDTGERLLNALLTE